LGSILGNGENLSKVLLQLLGEYHLVWIRYFLLKDYADVGLKYRNIVARFRDINPNEMEIFEFFKVAWRVFSRINTIFVNIISNEEIN